MDSIVMNNTEKPGNQKNQIFELLALVSAAISMVLAILGTTLTCACSASKTWSKKKSVLSLAKMQHNMSFVCIISIIAIAFAAVAIVMAILALGKNRKSLIAVISLAVGIFAALYAFIPMMTICSYNCSLENAYEKELNKQIGGSLGDLGDLFD